MKKRSKRVLTQSDKKTNLRRMPVKRMTTPTRQKRSQIRPLKHKRLSVVERYRQFFIPTPSPLWQHDEDNFSLEQPSPYKWVPSETTYGIDVTLCPTPNA
jgi:hypothetical protein